MGSEMCIRDSYMMLLTLGHVDIVVRRNTAQKPCIEEVPEYDDMYIEYVLKRVGCKPPYWNSTSSLKLCSEHQQLVRIKELYYDAALNSDRDKWGTIGRPCRSLERVSYHVNDLEMPANKKKNRFLNESVGMMLKFTENTYKEVKHVPGMDAQALIGKSYSSDIPI